MSSSHEYEMREFREYQKQIHEIERAPLADRKEACANFLHAMAHDPERVGERVGWLLDGNYGYGAMKQAKQVLARKRMNRPAALTHMIAALEWRCPGAMAAKVWHKLTPTQKAALDKAVKAEIKAAEEAEE